MAGGVASVAYLQTDATAGGGPVVLAKDFKLGGGGGGGKGGKGGKGGGPGWGPVIVGGIVVGLAHCAIRSERCEDIYGRHNEHYWRCMRRAGC
jgi:hypothetical protein